MFARLGSLAVVLWAVSTLSAAEDPVKTWTFDDGVQGWKEMNQCTLTAVQGRLRLESTGKDPHMGVEVKSPAGWQELTLRVRASSSRNIQVFWMTEASPTTTEALSVYYKLPTTGEAFRDHPIYFKTDSPLVGLRIDPDSGPTVTEYDAITLRNAAPPAQVATDPKSLKLPKGFQAELLYSVPSFEEGSWVSLALGPNGSFFVSDQHGKLYRVTPPVLGAEQAKLIVEPLPVELGMAQGLLWAFDALYVMINGSAGEGPGLYRVKDTDGDGLPDAGELLKKLEAQPSEHGPHAIVKSPDGKSLYVVAGNFTKFPADVRQPTRPSRWDEDQLLPRNPATNNHATGIMAPGGWVCKVDPEGKDWELICAGFRNPYDLAFNADGELFTFDADMEMDVGTPWYRPTRVCHVVSGGEYGWRYGTGKWPAYYADSLPPVVDVGLGSPTGIAFGYGAKFPARYQQALFISDWTNGKLYAVHLREQGASYTGDLEEFLSGTPLPLTDLVINPADGALYFTIGGRKTQSGFYRVTYHGEEPTAPAEPSINVEAGTARVQRRQLETLHTGEHRMRDDHWKLLGSEDRFLRFAARVAAEHLPPAELESRAFSPDLTPAETITAMVAMARLGDASHLPRIHAQLGALDWKTLSATQRLELLRAYGLSFIRLGAPTPERAQLLASQLQRYFPSDHIDVNHELCALLSYLNADQVAAKALPLMKAAKTQEDKLSYGVSLRVVTAGWTPALRKQYFELLNQCEESAATGAYSGGGHFQMYVQQMRNQAKEKLTDAELIALKKVIEAPIASAIPGGSPTPRKFIRAWTMDEILPMLPLASAGRSFEQGKELFLAANCGQCHRFNSTGGILGPDITGAVKRFSRQKLLQEIMEPSAAVSDQYQTHQITTVSGKVYEGRILAEDIKGVTMAADPTRPAYLVTIPRKEIEERTPSKVSMMPAGLLNTLTKEEILDLLAYIESGGNPMYEAFQAPAP